MVFNAQEIFEMAIQMERDGEAFYRQAAEEMSDSGVIELLSKLAEMEVEHEKTFTRMKDAFLQKETELFDPDGDAVLYLRSLAEGKIFDRDKTISSGETPEDVMETAIGLEKDSISYYVGIQRLVPNELGQNQIDEIIREEMRHVIMLRKELNRLAPKN